MERLVPIDGEPRAFAVGDGLGGGCPSPDEAGLRRRPRVVRRVLDPTISSDLAEWERLWGDSTARLPYAHPGIAAPLSRDGGRLLALAISVGQQSVLYPLVLREAPGGYRDVTSPYGYGGPLVHGEGDVAETAREFWMFFDEWAKEQRVVSEFARLSLFDDMLPHPGRVRDRTLNFVREIPSDLEAVWSGSSAKVRQNARRARRSGVTVRIAEDDSLGEDFQRIYAATMERRDSHVWYRFDAEFFADVHAGFPGRFLYFAAERDGIPVSMDLMLLGRDAAYYFLGGTDRGAAADRPNDLVKMAVMEWLSTNGYRWYVLGGGMGAGDGLERYKKGFAPEGARTFATAERVLDHEAYEELVEQRRAQAHAEDSGDRWDEGFFPLYRAPLVPGMPTDG